MDTIFHLDEATKWPTVLSNIPNYLAAAKEAGVSGQVELLINGAPVVDATIGSTIDLKPLVAAGVTVAVCHNAMASHHVAEADLQPGLTVVPAGVFELAKRQHEGYAYIKP
ncbi:MULTISPECIES: DsrE family protein [unclassified Lacticaseibacillus]|uniref:DsrE family protein n=1 Tax=unclassified Lacticaseibacillus TaxID=2759744 RepID=UPI001944C65F|nr:MULTISPECIES: DsrE family protein [unclassified Lacticaseibacillus]